MNKLIFMTYTLDSIAGPKYVAHQLIPCGLSLILFQSHNVAWLCVEECKMFCICCLNVAPGW